MKYHESREWKRYLELLAERPEAFADGMLNIITDEKLVDEFAEKTGKKPGVVYESPYHIMVVDLVCEKGEGCDEAKNAELGGCFTYERLLPAVPRGAVVAVPVFDGKFVLLRQFRHALREEILCFPRGFGEAGIKPEENLKKELLEEIGAEKVENVRFLGEIAGDSGALGTKAKVFACNISEPKFKPGYEGISAVELVSEEELKSLISAGGITDGFTLAAYALFLDFLAFFLRKSC